MSPAQPAHPAPATATGPGTGTGTMNRASLDSGLYLVRRAADEDARGNQLASLDLFVAGIDSLLFALPIHHPTAIPHQHKLDLQAKLLLLVDKLARATGQYPVFSPDGAPVGSYPVASAAPTPNAHAAGYPVVVLGPGPTPAPFPHTHTTYPYPYPYANPPPPIMHPHPPPTLSDTIITAAVQGAVALKQSPIPDAVTGAVTRGFKSLQQLDQTYKLRDKLVALGKASVTKAIDVDRQYQVHQKVGGALLTSLSAVTQAAVAYKNAPSYAEVAHQDAIEYPAPDTPAQGQQALIASTSGIDPVSGASPQLAYAPLSSARGQVLAGYGSDSSMGSSQSQASGGGVQSPKPAAATGVLGWLQSSSSSS
ncbi:hypothetical protein BCR44DRAFT_1499481 [Catenaria anguillulae PL171]|uniref:Uncharacterized protein n=1 Tax=Catenaria anguillulae PL171 TaxID=765915 RepID=A0A1Y2HLZ1_9FUNG|nr:hypothetical protein BCR44DRAFT_1499481 [Catenaria anguillulae PL171]